MKCLLIRRLRQLQDPKAISIAEKIGQAGFKSNPKLISLLINGKVGKDYSEQSIYRDFVYEIGKGRGDDTLFAVMKDLFYETESDITLDLMEKITKRMYFIFGSNEDVFAVQSNTKKEKYLEEMGRRKVSLNTLKAPLEYQLLSLIANLSKRKSLNQLEEQNVKAGAKLDELSSEYMKYTCILEVTSEILGRIKLSPSDKDSS